MGQEGFGFATTAAGFQTVPQLGRVILEDDVEVGANTTIDRGSAHDTVIGAGSVIDRAILDKVWGGLRRALEWHGNKNGCAVVGGCRVRRELAGPRRPAPAVKIVAVPVLDSDNKMY